MGIHPRLSGERMGVTLGELFLVNSLSLPGISEWSNINVKHDEIQHQQAFHSTKKALSSKTELKAIPLKVGMTRFELATPRPPDVCATGLRYIPKNLCGWQM